MRCCNEENDTEEKGLDGRVREQKWATETLDNHTKHDSLKALFHAGFQ